MRKRLQLYRSDEFSPHHMQWICMDVMMRKSRLFVPVIDSWHYVPSKCLFIILSYCEQKTKHYSLPYNILHETKKPYEMEIRLYFYEYSPEIIHLYCLLSVYISLILLTFTSENLYLKNQKKKGKRKTTKNLSPSYWDSFSIVFIISTVIYSLYTWL